MFELSLAAAILELIASPYVGIAGVDMSHQAKGRYVKFHHELLHGRAIG